MQQQKWKLYYVDTLHPRLDKNLPPIEPSTLSQEFDTKEEALTRACEYLLRSDSKVDCIENPEGQIVFDRTAIVAVCAAPRGERGHEAKSGRRQHRKASQAVDALALRVLPRDGSLPPMTLGKLDVLRPSSVTSAAGSGRYPLRRLIDVRGRDVRIIDWLDELTADCARKRARPPVTRCPDLPRVV
jgi:hypothetical protein